MIIETNGEVVTTEEMPPSFNQVIIAKSHNSIDCAIEAIPGLGFYAVEVWDVDGGAKGPTMVGFNQVTAPAGDGWFKPSYGGLNAETPYWVIVKAGDEDITPPA